MKLPAHTASPPRGEAPARGRSLLTREIRLSPTWTLPRRHAFFSELHVMLASGLGLREALQLSREGLGEAAAESVGRILAGYTDGSSLGECLRGEGFSVYEVQAVDIGERTHQLVPVCEAVAAHHHRMLSLRKKVRAALAYPTFVLALSVGILYFLLRYLVPVFADTFARAGARLPWLTRQVQACADGLAQHGGWLAAVAVLAAVALAFARSSAPVARARGWVALCGPGVSRIYGNVALAKASQSLALLLGSGVDLPRALRLCAEAASAVQLRDELADVAEAVEGGATLARAFAGARYFPGRYVALVRIAEEAGTLPEAFARLAATHEKLADDRAEQVKVFVEPLLIVGLGLVIGVVLVAMYLPLFSLTTLSR